MSDHELLQSYARNHAENAFATLVARYVDLVYSAARRQVRSPQFAEDITQSVFIELTRHAADIPSTQPLAAWLYVVTRRTALNALRQETRRLVRETAAAEFATMQTPSETWSKVEASIDEAMETLNDGDRTALVLRFFQNQSLREVGESLGISEDTAQKRVSRAVEQLRTFFLRRGLAVTAAGLASDLSANSLQIAPAMLSKTLVSLALSKNYSVVPVAVQTWRPIAMTVFQKTLIAAAALALVAGVFETWQIIRQRTELTALRERVSRGRSDLAALTRRRDDARRSLQVLTGGSVVFPPDSDPDLDAEIRLRLARVKQLRQVIEKNPHLNLLELNLLDNDDWLEVVKDRDPANEMELLSALLDLRSQAKGKFAGTVMQALRAYLVAHGGNLPSQIADLARVLPSSFDLAMLQRYELLHTGNVADLPLTPLSFERASVSGRVMGPAPEEESPALIAEQASLVLPPEGRLFIGRTGFVIADQVEFEIEIAVNGDAFDKAVAAFAKANHRAHPDEPEELLPYFDPPLDATTRRRITELAREMKRREANNPFLHLKQ